MSERTIIGRVVALPLWGLLFAGVRAVLTHHAARPAAFWLAAGVFLVAGGTPFALPVGRLPLALLVPGLAAAAVWLWPRRLVDLTGGPTGRWGLRHAHRRIMQETRRIMEATDGREMTRAEVERLRAETLALSRFGSPETAEFIDLAQEELLEWLGDREPDPEHFRRRSERILELGDRLWGGGPPPPSPAAPPGG